jgi:hypothetical protein
MVALGDRLDAANSDHSFKSGMGSYAICIHSPHVTATGSFPFLFLYIQYGGMMSVYYDGKI